MDFLGGKQSAWIPYLGPFAELPHSEILEYATEKTTREEAHTNLRGGRITSTLISSFKGRRNHGPRKRYVSQEFFTRRASGSRLTTVTFVLNQCTKQGSLQCAPAECRHRYFNINLFLLYWYYASTPLLCGSLCFILSDFEDLLVAITQPWDM